MAWLKRTLAKIWDGALEHTGTVLVAFVVTGGYFALLRWVSRIRDAIRAVPSDWFLTLLVLTLVALGVLGRLTYVQRRRLRALATTTAPPPGPEEGQFVTHFGVYWKFFSDQGYIEDFPYCTCCDPRRKLAQTDWYPHEKFACPVTKTQFLVSDGWPRRREQVLSWLYDTYVHSQPRRFANDLSKEAARLRELHPNENDSAIVDMMIARTPLRFLSAEAKTELSTRFSSPSDLLAFVGRHYDRYRRAITGGRRAQKTLPPER